MNKIHNEIHNKFGFFGDFKVLTAVQLEQSIKSLFNTLSITENITNHEELVISKLINSLDIRPDKFNNECICKRKIK